MFLKDSIQHLQDETIRVAGGHKDRLAALKAENRRQEIEIENAESRYKGKKWTEETIASEGIADVPSNALPVAKLEGWSGMSVVWNWQIDFTKTEPETINGITFTPRPDRSVVANGTATANVYYSLNGNWTAGNTFIVGHKYYVPKSNDLPNGSGAFYGATDTINDHWSGGIKEERNAQANTNRLLVISGTTLNNVVFKPRCADLTQMFGAGNEPTSIDDPRIQMIEEYAKDHPEFNAGQILSADAYGILSKGYNRWDALNPVNVALENSGYPPADTTRYSIKRLDDSGVYIAGEVGNIFGYYLADVKPGLEYEISTGTITHISGTVSVNMATAIVYDGESRTDAVLLSASVASTASRKTFVPSKPRVLVRVPFTGGNGAGAVACLPQIKPALPGNLRNEFTPYWQRIKPVLDEIRALPGYGWSAGDAKNYLYLDSGRVVYGHHVAEIDLGSVVWKKGSNGFYAEGIPYKRPPSNAVLANAICADFDVVLYANLADRGMSLGSNGVVTVKDSRYEDAASFKAAMSGIALRFEKAEQTETDITDMIPADWPLLDVEAGGTVEFLFDHGLRLPLESTITYQEKL